MSESTAEGIGDDSSGLTSFFFYVLVVHPATAWILRPGRFERKKGILFAITFLATLAAVKTGLEMHAKGPNYYTKLGVTRTSSPIEIKRAYKRLSLQLHPDKNPSPDASDQFDALKQSYDVLMDMELRQVYNKFGPDGIASNKRFDETQFFIELAVFYITWGIMVYILTLGKKGGDARQWIYTGIIVMLLAEISLMTAQNNPLPPWLLPTSTEHEAVWLMHALFPAFMNGCRSIGAYLYVDLDAQTRQLLLALQDQNKDILLVLRDVQITVQSIQAHGGGGGGGARLTSGGDGDTVPSGGPRASGGPLPKATPTGKIKELQERLQKSNTTVVQAVQELRGDSNKNSSLGFYAMILGYILISYIFS